MIRVVLLTVVLIVLMPQSGWAVCGHPGVSVSGTSVEIDDACRALGEVLSCFEAIGLRPEPEISIAFEDRVYIDIYLQAYAPEGNQPVGRTEVSGFYDSRRKELHIASVHRGIVRDRRPWGLVWSELIAYSILEHELVHAVVADHLRDDYKNLGKSWHEFIAYAVQFDLMDPALRRAVLANYPDAEPFRFPESVNAFVYGVDPDAFGVSAHLYAEANGGRDFIRRILSKQTGFGTSEFEFFWVK